MKNKKFNKDLLKEEVSKFKMMSEYSFYQDRSETEKDLDGKEVILGSQIFNEEEEEDPFGDEGGNEEDPFGDEGGNEEDPFGDEEGGEEESSEKEGGEEEDPFGDEEVGEEDPFGDEEVGNEEEPAEDEVELDVTELVKGSEEAKLSADAANEKIDKLMGMIGNLENQISSMDKISTKIDDLENELQKRAPTPEEKIEMRSLDSYPYNMKLTDFWANQKDQYDIIPDEEKEYVLNKQTIDKDYSDETVKDSFDSDNEYEEEDF
tara:strand:- start:147 stop:935 length:789 start_codon:yes stop_codon:yes gene_type:complete